VEAIAAMPLLLLAALVAWQLAAVVVAGLRAEERVRAAALTAGPAGGRVVTTDARVPVPALLPVDLRVAVSARAAVRTP
jgi:hypothetical protein